MTTTAIELPALELVSPLPGFPGHRRFTLVRLDEDGVLCQLSSLDEPGLRFLVMPPHPFFPDYAPEVSDEIAEQLQIDASSNVIVLLVLNAGGSLEATTANLLAPVLVNPVTRRAVQVILDDPDLPIAAPLVTPLVA